MSRKVYLYLGFFVLIAILFYFALVTFIPGYGDARSKPIQAMIPFSFTNQDGQLVSDTTLKGKVYVAEYFFTTCPGICKTMNRNMKKVYDALKEESQFRILAFTSDPATDSATQLKAYAKGLGVDTDKWIFLTGDKVNLYKTARFGFLIADPNNFVNNINDDFLHSQNWALVDKKGDVRRIYDGLSNNEVSELITDAKNLITEND